MAKESQPGPSCTARLFRNTHTQVYRAVTTHFGKISEPNTQTQLCPYLGRGHLISVQSRRVATQFTPFQYQQCMYIHIFILAFTLNNR